MLCSYDCEKWRLGEAEIDENRQKGRMEEIIFVFITPEIFPYMV